MKLEINIPTELAEVKLSQYQKFLKVAQDNEEDVFINQKMVQIFCGIDLKSVSEIKYKDVVEITNSLGRMFDVKSHKFVQRFKMGGVEFGFIPSLEDISFGEYTDLDNYLGDWEQMHRAMAVLYRPIKTNAVNGSYEIEKYNGSSTYCDVMKHAPLNVVLGANVFFYNLGNELLSSSMDYLDRETAKLTTQQQRNLETDGGGILQSMLLLKETLPDLMQLPIYRLRNA